MSAARVVVAAIAAALTLAVALPAAAATGSTPIISSFGIKPSSLPTAGGTLVASATVQHASTCRLAVSYPGKTNTSAVSCTSGSFRHSVTIPANNTSQARKYTFTFRATNRFGTSTAILTATQFPPPPSLISFTASPSSMGKDGGSDTISASFRRASTCTLTSSPSVGLSTSAFDCSSGSVSRTVHIPANTGAARTFTFKLVMKGAGGTTTATMPLEQAGS